MMPTWGFTWRRSPHTFYLGRLGLLVIFGIFALWTRDTITPSIYNYSCPYLT
ncbi:hypothetical protein [Nostoc sp. C110]|uniref:hypothetical protein n=1 Tax=Nostoc sp. C110 TaxID=3349876 RepID=UPI00370DA40D